MAIFDMEEYNYGDSEILGPSMPQIKGLGNNLYEVDMEGYKPFFLQEDPLNVWPATGKDSTGLWIAQHAVNEIRQNRAETQDPYYRVLDIGAGTGAIGLSIASSGSANEIIMSDNNTKAVRLANHNVGINQLPSERFFAVHANVFPQEITPSNRVNVIVANVPMLPEMETIARLTPAQKSNTNGPWGNYVLKEIISKGKHLVKDGGIIITSMSSRQDDVSMLEMIYKTYGKENVTLLNPAIEGTEIPQERELSWEYIGAYYTQFAQFTIADGTPRVYFKDQFGKPIIPLTPPKEGEEFTLVTDRETGIMYVRKINGILRFQEISNEDTSRVVEDQNVIDRLVHLMRKGENGPFNKHYILKIQVRK